MNSHQRRKQFRATKREFPVDTHVTLKYSSFYEAGVIFIVSRYSSMNPFHVLIKPSDNEQNWHTKGWYSHTNNLIKALS